MLMNLPALWALRKVRKSMKGKWEYECPLEIITEPL